MGMEVCDIINCFVFCHGSFFYVFPSSFVGLFVLLSSLRLSRSQFFLEFFYELKLFADDRSHIIVRRCADHP